MTWSPPRSNLSSSSEASDVYKLHDMDGMGWYWMVWVDMDGTGWYGMVWDDMDGRGWYGW